MLEHPLITQELFRCKTNLVVDISKLFMGGVLHIPAARKWNETSRCLAGRLHECLFVVRLPEAKLNSS